MHPISELLCKAYAKLHSQEQVAFPLHEKQRHAIDAIVKTVEAEYFGFARFPTVQEKAVAYLCLIIKNHPVTDGNKRLSVLWFTIFCDVFELKPDPSPYTLDQIVVSIEKDKTTSMDELRMIVQEVLFKKN